VIRDTIAKMNMVAIGRVVLTRREHIIALESRGRGLVGLTLRYPFKRLPVFRLIRLKLTFHSETMPDRERSGTPGGVTS
jgi:hypothetical protein